MLEIGFVSRFLVSWACPPLPWGLNIGVARLWRALSLWVRFAYLGVGRVWYPAGGTGGLNLWGHALRAIFFVWAWLVTPPIFGAALSSTLVGIIPYFSRNASYFGRNESLFFSWGDGRGEMTIDE